MKATSDTIRRSLHSGAAKMGHHHEPQQYNEEFIPIHTPKAEEKEEPSWFTQHKSQLLFCLQVVAAILWTAFSIAAFIIDFKRAKFLWWAEVVVAVVVSSIFLFNRHPETFRNAMTRAETNGGHFWQKKINRMLTFAVLLAVFVTIIVYCTYENLDRLVSGLGLMVFISLCYLFSWKRRHVKWRPVVWGFSLQFVFALIILRTDAGYSAFEFLGKQMSILLEYTNAGSGFVFSYLAKGYSNKELDIKFYPVFAFSVIPTVIFFSSIVSILYYLGVLQMVIAVIGKAMAYTLGTSASESLNAAGNIFIGQTEAPLLIRPFLSDMTKSELHAVMTGGFATIAGGVLAIYISFGVPASHLLAASVMSAPAALAVSKLIYPETEASPSAAGKEYKIARGTESNVIEAAANGATVAVTLAANIVGMLIAFLALIACLDAWIKYFGGLVDWEEASFTEICGYFFYPIAWLMGVPTSDCKSVAKLLGYKIFVNEFVAYEKLIVLVKAKEISDRAVTISTYALCGFSNFGSIGVQLGGLTPLAPHRAKDLAKVVLSAMIAGNIACFMTACIAGLLYDDSTGGGVVLP